MIRYFVEHLIPLLFGAILAVAAQEITFDAKDLALWSLGLAVFFWVYSTLFEDLKRLVFFALSRRWAYSGLYAELYLMAPDRLAVAPFVVLHDLGEDELRVFGRVLHLDAGGRIQASNAASWRSTAISISRPDASTHELAYLFDGQMNASFGIHGTTRAGVPISASGDSGPRAGYFVTTDIRHPVQTEPGSRPFARIENLGERVDAYRFFSIKFDSASYRAFRDSCDRLRDRVSLRLRLFCEPSEAAFKRFLEKGGLKFLADHTPSGREYDDISAILRVATAPASPAASAAASSGAPAGPPSGAATAARAAAPEQIEGSG